MPRPDNAPRGRARKQALELGFDEEWAKRLANERPGDVERWYTLGEVPADEDPRESQT